MPWILLAFGRANFGLGIIGIFIPVLPTTVILLIALWAFSKSSIRILAWLWNHKRFSPPIRNWHEHQIISTKAKILAILTMLGCSVYVASFVAEGWILPLIMTAILLPVVTYILTRTSARPEQSIPARIDAEVN